MTFRDRLRAELDAQRINKKELAQELGISYSTLLSYIDARAVMPAADMAVRLASRLGVTVEYLVDGGAEQGGSIAHSQALLHELSKLSAAEQKELISAFLSIIHLQTSALSANPLAHTAASVSCER